MRYWFAALIIIICPMAIVVSAADEIRDGLVEKMKAGGHILMMRHALAPGNGDPPNFRLGDCATQRNLNERGREQARAIGKWLRSKGITAARVYSSQWCRCRETAELINLGPVTDLPALNSFYEFTEDRDPNLNALREFFTELKPDGPLVVLVTHQVTISALTDTYTSSGEGVLLDLIFPDTLKVVGKLDFDASVSTY